MSENNGLRSKNVKKDNKTLTIFFTTFYKLLLVSFLIFYWYHLHSAEIIKDRVVAFVDNTAITLSELELKYAEIYKVNPDITKVEVLNTMINRILLLREVQKIRLEAASDDELLREYIDLKIRAFIRIKEEDLKDFYNSHTDDFQGKDFEDLRDEIEQILIEKELNLRLKSHIEELRTKACIQILLNE